MTNFASKAAWGNYSPASNGWGGNNDPFRHESVLVPFTYKTRAGKTLNFGRGHRLFVPIAKEALRILEPHVPGGFQPDPDEGCFARGSKTVGGDRSFHTFGIAMDVEWKNNPMGPSKRPTGPQTLPKNTGALVRHLGLQWGGDWSSPHDWMHIELHLNPGNAAKLIKELAKPAPRPVPHPAPAKPGKPPAPPKFPLPLGHYFGDIDGPNQSHGGINAMERHNIQLIFTWLKRDGYWHDAIPSKFDGPKMASAVRRCRRVNGWSDQARVGKGMWVALASNKAKDNPK